ncbi:MAG: hypothetical protein UZ14_CFX002003214 [Chloroflexi bacterium OLB14]|nr:MAG: hypothetical protein UZ14_CFX002003214 [Chloroflexi bacterium OLB14]
MPLPRDKPLSLAIQKACIQEQFPQFRFSKAESSWIGILQPTIESPEYLIKIIYKLYTVPRVFVLKPKLHPDAPHIYKHTGSLCLYFPDDKSWTSQKLLGKTIFLWTAEWLYYYEIWLSTGQWYAPEAPHNDIKREDN